MLRIRLFEYKLRGFFAKGGKKGIQKILTFRLHYAAVDLGTASVIARSKKVDLTAGSTVLRIESPEKDAAHARIYYRAGTHRTRLQRDVNIALREPPVGKNLARFSDSRRAS